MSNAPLQLREITSGFTGEEGFSDWLPVSKQTEESLKHVPGCYELALADPCGKPVAVVYGGGTLDSNQRAKDYHLKLGDHHKAEFKEAREKGFSIVMRMRKFATEKEAFIYEQQMLHTFDYAWNTKDQKKQQVRALDEVLRTKKTTAQLQKRPLVPVTREFIRRIESEKGQRQNSDRKNYYAERLRNAEHPRTGAQYLDNMKPRQLVFKQGEHYDATKPLVQQLDMRVKLNRLYVKRAREKDTSRLNAKVDEKDVHRPVTRSQTLQARKEIAAEKKKQVDKTASKADSSPTTKFGKPDMRFRVNREAAKASSSSALVDVPRTASGSPDMRYKVNRTTTPSSAPTPGPVTKSGKPDLRYKANRAASPTVSSSPSASYGSPTRSYGGGSGPVTKSGRPDMRYKQNW